MIYKLAFLLTYVISSGIILNRPPEYLKYKVLSRDAMDEAKEGCVGENATLWEVLQGGNEWDSIYQSLSEDTRRAIWINAKALETCTEHLGKD